MLTTPGPGLLGVVLGASGELRRGAQGDVPGRRPRAGTGVQGDRTPQPPAGRAVVLGGLQTLFVIYADTDTRAVLILAAMLSPVVRSDRPDRCQPIPSRELMCVCVCVCVCVCACVMGAGPRDDPGRAGV